MLRPPLAAEIDGNPFDETCVMTLALLHADDLFLRASRIRLLVLDVDGVLTDGKLYFSAKGDEIKAFNTLDGQGIKLLQKSGVTVAIVTGRSSELTARRARDLGITHLVQGREDKFVALQEILEVFPVDLEHIAFMGDDYPDLTVMTRVGLALAPHTATEPVLERAHWHSRKAGGEGAVREACDLIMRAQGTYQAALEAYLT